MKKLRCKLGQTLGTSIILSVKKEMRNMEDTGVEIRRWLVREARKITIQKAWEK